MPDLRAEAQWLEAEAEDRHAKAARAREEHARKREQRRAAPERNDAGEGWGLIIVYAQSDWQARAGGRGTRGLSSPPVRAACNSRAGDNATLEGDEG